MSARCFLLTPGKLGVRCVGEDGRCTTVLERGFHTRQGMFELLEALELAPGDSVALSHGASKELHDALELRLMREYGGVIPLVHDLAWREPGAAAQGQSAPVLDEDLYAYIEYSLRANVCLLAIPAGSKPGMYTVSIPTGVMGSVRLITQRPDSPPWRYRPAAQCALPGKKEVARRTVWRLSFMLITSQDGAAELKLELKPDGKLEVEIQHSGEEFRDLRTTRATLEVGHAAF